MRISGGALRGRVIQGPKGEQTRPTSTQVRAAIFNILGHDLSGIRVLDLFAGSGGLGIEALSRGADSCTFVEAHRLALDALKRNLRELDLEKRTRVLPCSVLQAWPRLSQEGPFDLVFADPPYELQLEGLSAALWVAQHLCKASWWSPGGRFVVESGAGLEEQDRSSWAVELQVRRYGGTYLWIGKRGSFEEP